MVPVWMSVNADIVSGAIFIYIDEYKYYEPLVDKVLAFVKKPHERIWIAETKN